MTVTPKLNSNEYIFRKMHALQGYIDPLDALVFCDLVTSQSADGHSGALFEIGVYYGRSFFLLDLLRTQDDALLGADIFQADGPKFGKGHQKRKLLEASVALGLRVDESNLLEGDSSKLDPSEITSRIGDARFIHVDGSHDAENVLADSKLSAAVLTDSGIICYDDFFNTEWPEVTTACLEFLNSQDLLVPFLITDKKLYVCPRSVAEKYRNILISSPNLKKFFRFDRELLAQPVVVLGHPLSRRALYQVASKTPLRGLSRHLYL